LALKHCEEIIFNYKDIDKLICCFIKYNIFYSGISCWLWSTFVFFAQWISELLNKKFILFYLNGYYKGQKNGCEIPAEI
jgi:hypothetical protein